MSHRDFTVVCFKKKYKYIFKAINLCCVGGIFSLVVRNYCLFEKKNEDY